jgi:VanZ family protein
MAGLWLLSSDPDPAPDLGALQTAAAKLAHLVVYAALWLAFAWALRFRRPLLAFVLTVAYGAVDELHQAQVDGRHGTPVDVAIDAAGAAIAWAVTVRVCRRRRRDAG